MSAVYIMTKLIVYHSSETNISWQPVCQNFRSLFFKKLPECRPRFACRTEQVYEKYTPCPFCIEVAIELMVLLNLWTYWTSVWRYRAQVRCMHAYLWKSQCYKMNLGRSMSLIIFLI